MWFGVLSQFVFLSFVTIWVFRFCDNLSFWVLLNVKEKLKEKYFKKMWLDFFVTTVITDTTEDCHNLRFWCHNFEFLSFAAVPLGINDRSLTAGYVGRFNAITCAVFDFSDSTSKTLRNFFFRIVIIQHFWAKLLSIMILDHRKCPKPENLHFHFLIGALPEVQNQFWKQFRSKVLYNYRYKFFFWSVCQN